LVRPEFSVASHITLHQVGAADYAWIAQGLPILGFLERRGWRFHIARTPKTGSAANIATTCSA
jgi:hypothetical protein